MKKEHVLYFHKNIAVLSRRDRVFLNNPVLIRGIGLAPIVVAATTLNNALVLAVAVILMLTPTRILSAILAKRVKTKYRVLVYALTAGVLYIAVSFILEQIFGLNQLKLLGLYLPLLIVEPLIIKRYVQPKPEKIKAALYKGTVTTLGFLLVLFLVAALREFLAYGTLYGFEIINFQPLPFAKMVAGGFIIVGLVAALWNFLINLFKKYINMEAKKYL